MKYIVEDSLRNFEFCGGAKDRADALTTQQLDIAETVLEAYAPEEGWTEDGINDFFRDNFDTIVAHLGYEDEEHFLAEVSIEDVEEAEEWAEDISTDHTLIFKIAGLNIEDYEETNDDGENVFDMELATEDFMDWWNDLDDITQVKIYRQYNK